MKKEKEIRARVSVAPHTAEAMATACAEGIAFAGGRHATCFPKAWSPGGVFSKGPPGTVATVMELTQNIVTIAVLY